MQKNLTKITKDSGKPLSDSDKLLKIEKKVTLLKCLRSSLMHDLKSSVGETNIKSNIGFVIKTNLDAIGITINSGQFYMIVQDIFNQFEYETFEDIVLLFKDIRTGKYGKLYGKIDFPFIADCMKKQLEEKAILRERLLVKRFPYLKISD